MKQEICKKLLVFSVALMFFGLIAVPSIYAKDTANNMITNSQKYSPKITNSDPIHRLIILTPEKFADELQPLADHKEEMGITTRIVTLDEIYEGMYLQGRDDAEKIKYYIKNAIESWGTEFVLLVGGKIGQWPSWHFPVRYVNMECDWESEYLSDLYFADIYDSQGNFSSWDSDEDGIFGEWYENVVAEDQDIDLYPDVAVGRLPCRNSLEVQIVVKKIIEYETSVYGKAWFNDVLVVAGDTYPEAHNPLWKGYEGEYYADRAIENMTEFNPTKLFTSDGTFTGEDVVIDTFSNGFGFVYFVGHGSPMSWGNNAPNGTEYVRGLRTKTMHRLRNGDKLPICVVSGCHNSQFDVSIFRYFNKTRRYHMEHALECWSWRMTRKIRGGSVATLGCSALGYTKEDKDLFKGGINELEVQFFRQYGQNNVSILGETWKAAISWYIDTYPVNWDTPGLEDSWIDAQVIESWTLFGDPSLQIGGYAQ